MKQKYNEPSIEVVEVISSDVITSSSTIEENEHYREDLTDQWDNILQKGLEILGLREPK